MKKLICMIIGHVPKGPIERMEFSRYGIGREDVKKGRMYRCDRCQQYIYFDSKRGWMTAL